MKVIYALASNHENLIGAMDAFADHDKLILEFVRSTLIKRAKSNCVFQIIKNYSKALLIERISSGKNVRQFPVC